MAFAETSLRKNTEERLEQARLAAEAAADKFRTELAERREAESRLEQSVAERTQDLAAANLQLQAKRDELKQTEERMEQARLAPINRLKPSRIRRRCNMMTSWVCLRFNPPKQELPLREFCVAHAGFEPAISALRGRRPGPLDECGA